MNDTTNFSAGSSSTSNIRSVPWKSIFQEPSNFKQYFTVKSENAADMRRLNIFKLDRELKSKLGSEPQKISNNADGTLTIQVVSEEQANKLKLVKTLVDEKVIVEEHQRYNECKGVIVCDLLRGYSEKDILEGLRERKVKNVFRFKKMVNGTLTDTDSLLLTFDFKELPEKIKIRSGLYERVRPYYPSPRRCYNCQRFGHVGKYCRSSTALCVDCGLPSHKGTECTRSLTCVNCGGSHSASSKSCDCYLFEKELIALKIKERLSFREAKERAMEIYVRPGVTFSSVIKKPLPTAIVSIPNDTIEPTTKPKQTVTPDNSSSNSHQPSTSNQQPSTSNQQPTTPSATDKDNNIEDFGTNSQLLSLENIDNQYSSPPHRDTTKRRISSPLEQRSTTTKRDRKDKYSFQWNRAPNISSWAQTGDEQLPGPSSQTSVIEPSPVLGKTKVSQHRRVSSLDRNTGNSERSSKSRIPRWQ